MRRRTARRFALLALLITIALGAFVVAIELLEFGTSRFSLLSLLAALYIVLFSVVGLLILSRQPENAEGWILAVLGLLFQLAVAGPLYAGFGQTHGSWPAGPWIAWLTNWIWIPISALAVIYVPLLFPTGRLLSPRWRVFGWSAGVYILLAAVGNAFAPHALSGLDQYLTIQNPVGIDRAAELLTRLRDLSAIFLNVAVIGAVASLVIRFRRAAGAERQQLKWFLYGCVLFMVPWASKGLITQNLTTLLFALLIPALPVSLGVAILKYRLYDIDIIINKSLVFAALAAFITAVYVAIVVGLGVLVGTAGKPNLALSILATVVVAVAFQPVRERVQGFANRLVYGRRATPYEVLAQFSERVAGVYSTEEILPRMARVLSEGTGAARADVWIRIGSDLVPTTSWPQGDGALRGPIAVAGQLLPTVPGVDRAVAVKHQGELLGALTISKRAGEALTPVEEKLLADLAAQAGLVLRNVRLTAELQARLEEIWKQATELRASRQRIVAAQDAERRRLERNIHDGAQQNLVALTVKLRLARNFASRNPQRAKEIVQELEAETGYALDTLRDLARGIYPPLLRENGLVAALQAHAGSMEIPIEVNTKSIGRYAADIEAAVYFCCLEALQNVAKHAGASRVQVDLHEQDGQLSFSVVDNGCGFDPDKGSQGSGLRNMMDRVEAVGGRLEVRSGSSGTTVSGRIPKRFRESIG